jgi:hypothetical protein
MNGRRAALNSWKMRRQLITHEGKMMKNKTLAMESVREIAENWAKGCQLSGRFHRPQARSWSEDRKLREEWLRNALPVVVILVFFLGTPGALGAQSQKGSWSELSRLKDGQGIEVIESSLKRHAGEFVTVTDEVLTLKESGSDVSIKREDVARVSTSSAPKRGEHAVIGLVAGAAIGAAIGAATGSSHGFLGGSSRGIAALVGIAIGGPSGALVGAVIPAHTTVYRAAPGTSHSTASP